MATPHCQLTIIDLADLLARIPGAPLAAGGIGATLVTARVESAPLPGLAGVRLTLAADASLEITGRGVAAGRDAGGEPGAGPAEAGAAAVGPPLSPGATALLEYRVTAVARASARLAPAFLTTDAGGTASVILADVHAHDPGENARDAVAEDLGRLRFATRRGDSARLGPGESLSLQARGVLRASLSLAWADVLTAGLGTLADLARPGTLVTLATPAAATLSAAVSVTDDFEAALSRAEPGRIRVAVRKGRSRVTSARGDLGLAVELDAGGAVTAVLADLLGGLAGVAVEKVDELLFRLTLEDLDADERDALTRAVRRLGLGELVDGPAALKARWEELKGRVAQAIGAVARQRVAAGFGYEYRRVGQGEAVLQLVVTDADAARLHPFLIARDLASVLAWLRAAGLTPERYLNETRLVREQAWGFSLGLGRWAVGGRDRVKLQCVEQTGFSGERRVAYLGVRGYEAELAGRKVSWSVDFKADTDRLAAPPLAADLSYGLHLAFHREAPRLSTALLEGVVDQAIVWGVLDEADRDEVAARLAAAAGAGGVRTRLEVRLDDAAWRAILPAISAGAPAPFARALARAMPRLGRFKVRAVVALREAAYAPLWLDYLGDPLMGGREAAARAEAVLGASRLSRDISRVEGCWPVRLAGTFAGLVTLNPATRQAWRAFVEGAASLRAAIAEGRPHTVVAAVFARLEDLWQQSHHVLALGAYLVQAARAAAPGRPDVERSLTLEMPATGERIALATARG